MNRPLISIIIPLYNKGEYIARTIHSILNQGATDFEIIVVNDGSTDNGPMIVEGIKDSRIRILNQCNSGVSSARNFGIHNATGQWVYFIDADDCMINDTLTILMNTAKTIPCNVILTNFRRQYNKHESSINIKIKQGYVNNPFFWLVIYKLKIITGSILVKRDIALEEPFNDNLSRYEDHDVFYRWLSKGKVYFLPVPLVKYDVRAARGSKVNQNNFEMDFLYNLDFHVEGFWYKCQLGKLLYEGTHSYPEKQDLFKKRYHISEKKFAITGYILALFSRMKERAKKIF